VTLAVRQTLRLVVRSPEASRHVRELGPGEHRIGRLDACDVVLPHPSVSRIHARIEFDPEVPRARLHDARSENGIEVNGRRVRWSDVRAGDRVRIGAVEVDVELGPGVPDAAWPAREAERAPRAGGARRLLPPVAALALGGALVWFAASRSGREASLSRGEASGSRERPRAAPVFGPSSRARAPTAAGSAGRADSTATAAAASSSTPSLSGRSGSRTADAALASSRPREPEATSTARSRRSPGEAAGAERKQAAGPASPASDRLRARLARRHPGDAARITALVRYVQGDFAAAQRALASSRSAEARALRADLEALERAQARVRTELSNDPARARDLLEGMVRTERRLLPSGFESYVVSDLERALADAFSRRGASRFESRRYAAAFRDWTAGREVDPRHPGIRAGLARIDRVARRWAEEAEIADQRGDELACAMWRRVVRVTARSSDLHGRARRRTEAVCR